MGVINLIKNKKAILENIDTTKRQLDKETIGMVSGLGVCVLIVCGLMIG